MKTLRFFDANCVLGRHLHMRAGGPHTARDLLEDMDHFGVSEALVLDSLSRECHPAEGNPRILEAAAESPRLRPAWAALPPGTTEEQPEPAELLRRMREARVGALFLLPGQYRFSLSDWCVDELLEPMVEAKVPVFINFNDIGPDSLSWDQTDWDAVVDLCRRFPALPVIVSEWRIRRADRMIYRALDRCENLRIELSGCWLYRFIEYVSRRWGPRRLIFGSHWPVLGHGPAVAALSCAEIEDNEKRLIAGDNLRELLQWNPAESPDVDLPAPADDYARFGRTGERPATMRFWDCHGHLGRSNHYHVRDGAIEDIVAEMDRLGVERVCAFSFAGVHSDERHGNDVVAAAVRAFPDRFVGLTLLNPHRGRDDMLRELDRCAALGLRGVKLIPFYQGYPEEGPLIEVACRWAHERRQIILNHNWGSPEWLERLVSLYPNACFVTGHTTTAYADIMKRFPNLYVCSCPLLGPRECEQVVGALGADRLLFGSDLLDLPVAWGLGPILFSRLSESEKEMILGGNLRRILSRYSLNP